MFGALCERAGPILHGPRMATTRSIGRRRKKRTPHVGAYLCFRRCSWGRARQALTVDQIEDFGSVGHDGAKVVGKNAKQRKVQLDVLPSLEFGREKERRSSFEVNLAVVRICGSGEFIHTVFTTSYVERIASEHGRFGCFVLRICSMHSVIRASDPSHQCVA